MAFRGSPVRSRSAPPSTSLPLGRDLRLQRTGERLGRMRPRSPAWSLAALSLPQREALRSVTSARLFAMRRPVQFYQDSSDRGSRLLRKDRIRTT